MEILPSVQNPTINTPLLEVVVHTSDKTSEIAVRLFGDCYTNLTETIQEKKKIFYYLQWGHAIGAFITLGIDMAGAFMIDSWIGRSLLISGIGGYVITAGVFTYKSYPIVAQIDDYTRILKICNAIFSFAENLEAFKENPQLQDVNKLIEKFEAIKEFFLAEDIERIKGIEENHIHFFTVEGKDILLKTVKELLNNDEGLAEIFGLDILLKDEIHQNELDSAEITEKMALLFKTIIQAASTT